MTRHRSRLPHLLLLLLAGSVAGCYQRSERLPRVVDPDEGPVLRLGVVPTRTPRDELLRYGVIGDRVMEATGHRLEVRPAATWSILRERLAAGELDLAVLGAVAHARTRVAAPVGALARELVLGETSYRAVIVVREDGPIRSLGDLAGRRLALAGPESTTGQLLPLAALRGAGLAPADLGAVRYLDRQEEIARAVRLGEADAGAVREEVARRHVGAGLRVLWRSEALPGPVLVARTDLSDDLRADIREALLLEPVSSPVRPVPAEAIPRFAPLGSPPGDGATAAVEALMAEVYGPGALERDLRLRGVSAR